jgi:hypothetical protein
MVTIVPVLENRRTKKNITVGILLVAFIGAKAPWDLIDLMMVEYTHSSECIDERV